MLRKEVAALRAQINCNAENALRLQSELTAMSVERDLANLDREKLSENVVALRAICEVMSPRCVPDPDPDRTLTPTRPRPRQHSKSTTNLKWPPKL